MRIVCPMCKQVLEEVPEDYTHRPFCSARCKLADLDNWLSGIYRISRPLGEQDTDESLLN